MHCRSVLGAVHFKKQLSPQAYQQWLVCGGLQIVL